MGAAPIERASRVHLQLLLRDVRSPGSKDFSASDKKRAAHRRQGLR